MRKFMVNVNGANYEVMVEEITGAAAAAPMAAPAPVAVAPAAPVAAGGETIAAPMPGTILAVNVQVGQAVKKGQVAMILEAMKMENEIMVPADGTVKSVNVVKGATVNSGDVLLVIG
ncbi:biotin/lipoyl-binding protein [Christensenellaceae bacterium OttesenSCG-928-M15]|nr:biotin/lipoyl-binding protein [Christensenellaceae bacterium OttesenSCG-928-M15]